MLQPLVENSIYHGFQVKKTLLNEQSNQITIKVYANIGINSDILIEIYDNAKPYPTVHMPYKVYDYKRCEAPELA